MRTARFDEAATAEAVARTLHAVADATPVGPAPPANVIRLHRVDSRNRGAHGPEAHTRRSSDPRSGTSRGCFHAPVQFHRALIILAAMSATALQHGPYRGRASGQSERVATSD